MTSGFKTAALEIAGTFGCPVFPLHPNTKNPATGHGFKDASSDAAVIEEWWSRNPRFNVAYATGNKIVIDVDDHSSEGGADGLASLDEWVSKNGELPKTVTVKTGRGHGYQMVFDNVERRNIKNTTNSGLGLDVRGYGGYAVAPGSIHPNGNLYHFINSPEDTGFAPVDDHVLSLIKWIGSKRRKNQNRRKPKSAVGVGARNDSVFREASRLQGLGLPDGEILARAEKFNLDECEPPLDRSEVIQAASSALRYEKGDSFGLVAFFGSNQLQKLGINDKTLGKLFASCARDRLAYVPEDRAWFAYDGKCWIKSGGAEIAANAMKDFVTAAAMYCATIEDDDSRAAAIRLIARYQQHNARSNVLEDAKSEMVRHKGDFDQNPYLLNCQNCTLDFSGSEPIVRDHSSKDLLTQVANVAYMREARCELFTHTLSNAVEGDIDFLDFIQKLYGKVVAGDTSDDALYFWGEMPRTGKGTVTAPLVEMLGTYSNGYAKNCQPETFAVSHFRSGSASSGDRARLRGAKLIITSEPPKGMELDATLVKEMTGGDLLTARFNYGDDIQFRITGLIFMLANNFPIINDPSVFDSGRAVVIPFNRFVRPEERDSGLRDKLKEPDALSGLLNFCIEGFRKYRAEGFSKPDVVSEASSAYIRRMDEMANFEDCCLVPAAKTMKVRASDVWSRYEDWCGKRGSVPIAKSEFFSRLRQRPYWRDRATIDGKTVKRVVVGREIR